MRDMGETRKGGSKGEVERCGKRQAHSPTEHTILMLCFVFKQQQTPQTGIINDPH
jgi:hypothetical protein